LVVAIAEFGSMTKAGNHLNLTQSALSHQLRDIEDRLGSPLFRRLNKKMDLTPCGERLLESARRVLSELVRAEDDLQRVGSERRGVLRLSTECYTSYRWLPARLKLFARKYPHLDVHVTTEPNQRSIQALLDGKLDVAIMCDPKPNRRLRFEPLFKDEMVVAMRPGHRLASNEFVRPEELVDEHVLLNAPSAEDSTIMQRVLRPSGVIPHRVTYAQLTEGVVELLKGGVGIGVLARWSIFSELESGALVASRLTRKGFMRPWHAVMTRSNSAPPYFMEFARLIADHPVTADGH
jgi:LysR family transcriptional regulator, regulator for metE and metH